jgi:ABC-type transporter Mla subunit MlaD
MTTKLFATAAVTVLALAAAGCGGSDETSAGVTPASQWADGFCTAVTSWTDTLKSVPDQFTDLSSLSEENFQAAADDISSATDSLVEDLKGLGAPDTDSGEEVKSSIDDLSSTLETELDSIQTTLDDTSGITELPGAAQDILASLSAMSSAFATTLSTVEDADVQGELKDALESSSACDEVTS